MKQNKRDLKGKVERFKQEYKSAFKTPAVSRLWFYLAAIIATGVFIIYGPLGGDPGLRNSLLKLGWMENVAVGTLYVALMTFVLWPVGIFLETVRRVSGFHKSAPAQEGE